MSQSATSSRARSNPWR